MTKGVGTSFAPLSLPFTSFTAIQMIIPPDSVAFREDIVAVCPADF